MGRRRRRRQLVTAGVLLGVSLLAFWLGGPVTALWPSAAVTVGLASFVLFLVALWLFLLVIAEREGPPPGAPTLANRPASPGWWPFQRRQPPRPPEPLASSVAPWPHHTWEDRVVPLLRRVTADETLELLLVDDRGEGPIGTKREVVVALSTQDLLMMSAALRTDATAPGGRWSSREIGFDADDALAWSRRAARAARDAPALRPGPPSIAGVGARRIAWTAWALAPEADGGRQDPWFAVPLDQLEAVTNAVAEVADGDEREERWAAAELVGRLRVVLRDSHELDPLSASDVGSSVDRAHVVRAGIRWEPGMPGGRTVLLKSSNYRPLVWFGVGEPEFTATGTVVDGHVIGAICSRPDVGDHDGRHGEPDREVVELRFVAVEHAPVLATGDRLVLLEGRRIVARGIVVGFDD